MRLAAYRRGFDVVGVSVDDFMPWISAAGKAAGGLSGGFASGLTGGALDLARGGGKKSASTASEVKKAVAEEERKRAQAASARTTRILLYGTLGVLGVGVVGATVWAIARK